MPKKPIKTAPKAVKKPKTEKVEARPVSPPRPAQPSPLIIAQKNADAFKQQCLSMQNDLTNANEIIKGLQKEVGELSLVNSRMSKLLFLPKNDK